MEKEFVIIKHLSTINGIFNLCKEELDVKIFNVNKLQEIIIKIYQEHIRNEDEDDDDVEKNFPKRRIGFTLKIPDLQSPIHIEYSKPYMFVKKLKTITSRLEKVIQSNETININKIKLIFTIININ